MDLAAVGTSESSLGYQENLSRIMRINYKLGLGTRNVFPHGLFNWKPRFFFVVHSTLAVGVVFCLQSPDSLWLCCAGFYIHQGVGRVLNFQPWRWGPSVIYCCVFVPFVTLAWNSFVFLLSSLTLSTKPRAYTFLWVPKTCPHPAAPGNPSFSPKLCPPSATSAWFG